MTREEAIKILKAIRVYECYPKSASEETKEAIDMAIEALSANAKTKCVAKIEVDTEEIIKRIKEEYDIIDVWIPCSERLPKEEKKTYWVCTDTEYQCECRWTNNRFGLGEGEWGWSIFDTPLYTKPIAWRSLPEPYKGGDK